MTALIVPLVILAIAAYRDLRSREIPDAFALALLAWAVVQWSLGWAPASGIQLLAGLGAGLLLFILLAQFEGFGGGDGKLLVAIGPILGLPLYLKFLFAMALAGGLLSLVALARKRSDLAYVPAIALGMAAVVIWHHGGG